MKLNGKCALITGAGSGIGRAIAELFAQEGAAVALNNLGQTRIFAVAKDMTARGFRARAIIGDVSKSEDARRLVQEAVSFLGGLDILVNSAGIGYPGSVTSTSDEDWDRQIAVNLNGVYHVSRFAIPQIIKAGGGAIINISSISAFLSSQEFSAYGATKAAVLQLTRSMAADYAPYNIRVNCICPGPTDTPMLNRTLRFLNPDHPEEARRTVRNLTLMKRIGRPEEIAMCALFLASDMSTFVTGHALVADGGMTVH